MLLSKAMCSPPPKPVWDGNSLLQPRQDNTQEPSLGLLGEDFASAQLGRAVPQSLITSGCLGVEALHAILSLIVPLLGFSTAGLEGEGPLGKVRCLCVSWPCTASTSLLGFCETRS